MRTEDLLTGPGNTIRLVWKTTGGFNQRVSIHNIGIQWAVTASSGETLERPWVTEFSKLIRILLHGSAENGPE